MKQVMYVRFDNYSDFPNLKTSAERGYAYCVLLRCYAIRKNWTSNLFREHRVGDTVDSTPAYTNILAV